MEEAVNDLLRIIFNADKDESMTIGLNELDMLTLTLRMQLQSKGVDLDEKKFKAMVQKNNNIDHILKVTQAIMFGQALQGTDHDAAAEALVEEEQAHGAPHDDEDLSTMFTVHERFTKGSVAAARGSKPSLYGISADKPRGARSKGTETGVFV